MGRSKDFAMYQDRRFSEHTAKEAGENETHVIFLTHSSDFDSEQLEPRSPVRRLTEQVAKVEDE